MTQAGRSQGGNANAYQWEASPLIRTTESITPIVADALATWGDWKNATWIWESVLVLRPFIVAMIANVVRGHLLAKEFTRP